MTPKSEPLYQVNVNTPAGPCGWTPLLRAARTSDSASVAALYRAGANVSAQDCRGCLAHHLPGIRAPRPSNAQRSKPIALNPDNRDPKHVSRHGALAVRERRALPKHGCNITARARWAEEVNAPCRLCLQHLWLASNGKRCCEQRQQELASE